MFETYEVARFLGLKVALYRFALGSAEWLYTSATRDVTRDGKTYLRADGVSHGALRESGSSSAKNQVTITLPYRLDPSAADLPATQPLGDVFWPWAPTGRVLVTVMTTHLGDVDEEVVVEWMGRAVAPKFDGSKLELVCDASYRAAGVSGDVRRIQRACDVRIYSQGTGRCNLDPEAHKIEATLTAVSGLQLTAAEFAAAPRNLAGGFVEWTRTGGLLERRTIWGHSDDTITVNYFGPELDAGLAVVAYPGCAHNYAACQDYGNGANYPGWRDLPTTEPMARSQAWG
ncbi:MAG: DUF2163 domain-containing protein [Burkholderiaceae bacterium]|nr:DUF2163 domain-containing protein [Burkholderiaceae bacterium]